MTTTEANAAVAPVAQVQAPATAPKKPDAPKTAPKVNGKTAAPKKADAKKADAPRGSRVAPIMEALLKKLSSAPKARVNVAAFAQAQKCTEREVRLAIDRARNKAVKIDRVAKGEFAFAPGYKHKA